VTTKSWIRPTTLVLALIGAMSCGDSTAPIVRSENELHFVRFATDAPKILDTTLTFWAKKGTNSEIRLRYAGGTEDFLRFEVPGNALDRRPDGSVIAQGDSIQITVMVADLSQLMFEFQPAGLRFSPDHPARLKIEFQHGDDDLDRNGVVDAADIALRTTLGIWRRERPTDPWVQISNALKLELDEADADIFGFTTYALAY
jgi:hypothetical protein